MEGRRTGTPMKARLPVWRRLAWRLGASVLLLTALGILLSGFLQYRAQDRWLRQSLGGLLLNIARTGALLVDGDLHRAVVERGRNDTPAYERIRSQLQRIQATNRLGDPVYTLSDIEGDEARFAAISDGQEPVGKRYRLAPEIQPILHRVLAEGTAAYTDIYVNEHGTWMTAFAPIRDAAGRTVAALDVDFRADVYLAELGAVRRRLYLHSLAGAMLALFAGVLLARQITRPVGQLSAVARRVVEGDLSTRVRIAARDEIGLLGNVFHLMVERLHVSHRSMVDVLVRALEARGGEAGALPRVAGAALAVAERLELSPTQREALELGALLHDIGEIRTPEALLQKAGPLTPEERRVVEQHPAWGVDILETVPLLTPALDVVGGHHERYDGKGYPQGLRGEEIPLAARIFAVADALDAITHDRPHRSARPVSEALEELRREAGKQFDPRVADAALAIPPARWAELLGGQEPARVNPHAGALPA
ncbi:MAG: HD-GYP domain-containing protein [Candidatus Methylomirabilales bacterium]